MPRPGDELIPGYRLQAKIGHGAFGEVWRASGPGETLLALKLIDLGGKSGLKEFRAIQRIKQVRHPLLLPITGIWILDQEGKPFDEQSINDSGFLKLAAARDKALDSGTKRRPSELVVAMLLGDKSLDDRLRECREEGREGIPPTELLIYLADAARAIDFLNAPRHDMGAGLSSIQHGDIKPRNILLVGETAQVCDFGLARVLSDTRSATDASFSAAYVPPEVLSNRQPSQASDQYSLAITYFELRTGTLPFDGTTVWEVLEAHRESKLNLSRLNDAERAIIERATALKPEDRYPNSSEMVAALRIACRSNPQIDTPRPALEIDHEPSPIGSSSTLVPAMVDRGRKTEPMLQPTSNDFRLEEFPESDTNPDALAIRDTTTPQMESPLEELQKTVPVEQSDSLFDPPPAIEIHSQNVGKGRTRRRFAATVLSLSMFGFAAIGLWWTYVILSPDSPPVAPEEIAAKEEPSSTLPSESDPISASQTNGPNVRRNEEAMIETGAPPLAPTQNHSPSIDRIENFPEKPIVGQSVSLRVHGSDIDEDAIRLEGRLDGSDWQPLVDSRFYLSRVRQGITRVEFRAIDERGMISSVVVGEVTAEPWISPTIGMEFLFVAAGEFEMGSPAEEDNRNSDEVQHRVRVTEPFLLGRGEVTQAEFEQVMGFNPSHFCQGEASNRPVESVTWFDAIAFCNRLSTLEGKSLAYSLRDVVKEGNTIRSATVLREAGDGYRLPTEAQWEFACRGGTKTPFSIGTSLSSEQANFDASSPELTNDASSFRGETMEIDRFPPNPWGFRNMHGNVWEWCWDWYANYSVGVNVDPVGRAEGKQRVFRGGGWYSQPSGCRSAFRHSIDPSQRNPSLGFRVVILESGVGFP